MIISYSIFNEIVYQSVNKNITSHHRNTLTFSNKCDIFFLGKRFQVCQHLINKGIHYNFFIPAYRLKLTHIEKRLYHFAKPVVLFRDHLYRLQSLCIIVRMTGGII